MKNSIFSFVAIFSAVTMVNSSSEAQARSMEKIINNCMACHGQKGISRSFKTPTIAGQNAEYFSEQINSFLDRARNDSGNYFYMLPAIEGLRLTDSEIKYIADYFAKLPGGHSRIVHHDAAQLALGAEIYNKGIPSKNVTACITCHGEDGKGTGATPSLAGQDFFYTVKRFQNFKNDEDRKATMMPDIVKNMNHNEMKAVARYLNSI